MRSTTTFFYQKEAGTLEIRKIELVPGFYLTIIIIVLYKVVYG